jgi:hypothetical protein
MSPSLQPLAREAVRANAPTREERGDYITKLEAERLSTSDRRRRESLRTLIRYHRAKNDEYGF